MGRNFVKIIFFMFVLVGTLLLHSAIAAPESHLRRNEDADPSFVERSLTVLSQSGKKLADVAKTGFGNVVNSVSGGIGSGDVGQGPLLGNLGPGIDDWRPDAPDEPILGSVLPNGFSLIQMVGDSTSRTCSCSRSSDLADVMGQVIDKSVLSGEFNSRLTQFPIRSLSLPQLERPEFSLPEFSLPDLPVRRVNFPTVAPTDQKTVVPHLDYTLSDLEGAQIPILLPGGYTVMSNDLALIIREQLNAALEDSDCGEDGCDIGLGGGLRNVQFRDFQQVMTRLGSGWLREVTVFEGIDVDKPLSAVLQWDGSLGLQPRRDGGITLGSRWNFPRVEANGDGEFEVGGDLGRIGQIGVEGGTVFDRGEVAVLLPDGTLMGLDRFLDEFDLGNMMIRSQGLGDGSRPTLYPNDKHECTDVKGVRGDLMYKSFVSGLRRDDQKLLLLGDGHLSTLDGHNLDWGELGERFTLDGTDRMREVIEAGGLITSGWYEDSAWHVNPARVRPNIKMSSLSGVAGGGEIEWAPLLLPRFPELPDLVGAMGVSSGMGGRMNDLISIEYMDEEVEMLKDGWKGLNGTGKGNMGASLSSVLGEINSPKSGSGRMSGGVELGGGREGVPRGGTLGGALGGGLGAYPNLNVNLTNFGGGLTPWITNPYQRLFGSDGRMETWLEAARVTGAAETHCDGFGGHDSLVQWMELPDWSSGSLASARNFNISSMGLKDNELGKDGGVVPAGTRISDLSGNGFTLLDGGALLEGGGKIVLGNPGRVSLLSGEFEKALERGLMPDGSRLLPGDMFLLLPGQGGKVFKLPRASLLSPDGSVLAIRDGSEILEVPDQRLGQALHLYGMFNRDERTDTHTHAPHETHTHIIEHHYTEILHHHGPAHEHEGDAHEHEPKLPAFVWDQQASARVREWKAHMTSMRPELPDLPSLSAALAGRVDGGNLLPTMKGLSETDIQNLFGNGRLMGSGRHWSLPSGTKIVLPASSIGDSIVDASIRASSITNLVNVSRQVEIDLPGQPKFWQNVSLVSLPELSLPEISVPSRLSPAKWSAVLERMTGSRSAGVILFPEGESLDLAARKALTDISHWAPGELGAGEWMHPINKDARLNLPDGSLIPLPRGSQCSHDGRALVIPNIPLSAQSLKEAGVSLGGGAIAQLGEGGKGTLGFGQTIRESRTAGFLTGFLANGTWSIKEGSFLTPVHPNGVMGSVLRPNGSVSGEVGGGVNASVGGVDAELSGSMNATEIVDTDMSLKGRLSPDGMKIEFDNGWGLPITQTILLRSKRTTDGTRMLLDDFELLTRSGTGARLLIPAGSLISSGGDFIKAPPGVRFTFLSPRSNDGERLELPIDLIPLDELLARPTMLSSLRLQLPDGSRVALPEGTSFSRDGSRLMFGGCTCDEGVGSASIDGVEVGQAPLAPTSEPAPDSDEDDEDAVTRRWFGKKTIDLTPKILKSDGAMIGDDGRFIIPAGSRVTSAVSGISIFIPDGSYIPASPNSNVLVFPTSDGFEGLRIAKLRRPGPTGTPTDGSVNTGELPPRRRLVGLDLPGRDERMRRGEPLLTSTIEPEEETTMSTVAPEDNVGRGVGWLLNLPLGTVVDRDGRQVTLPNNSPLTNLPRQFDGFVWRLDDGSRMIPYGTVIQLPNRTQFKLPNGSLASPDGRLITLPAGSALRALSGLRRLDDLTDVTTDGSPPSDEGDENDASLLRRIVKPRPTTTPPMAPTEVLRGRVGQAAAEASKQVSPDLGEKIGEMVGSAVGSSMGQNSGGTIGNSVGQAVGGKGGILDVVGQATGSRVGSNKGADIGGAIGAQSQQILGEVIKGDFLYALNDAVLDNNVEGGSGSGFMKNLGLGEVGGKMGDGVIESVAAGLGGKGDGVLAQAGGIVTVSDQINNLVDEQRQESNDYVVYLRENSDEFNRLWNDVLNDFDGLAENPSAETFGDTILSSTKLLLELQQAKAASGGQGTGSGTIGLSGGSGTSSQPPTTDINTAIVSVVDLLLALQEGKSSFDEGSYLDQPYFSKLLEESKRLGVQLESVTKDSRLKDTSEPTVDGFLLSAESLAKEAQSIFDRYQSVMEQRQSVQEEKEPRVGGSELLGGRGDGGDGEVSGGGDEVSGAGEKRQVGPGGRRDREAGDGGDKEGEASGGDGGDRTREKREPKERISRRDKEGEGEGGRVLKAQQPRVKV